MTELDEYDAYLPLSLAISNDDWEGLENSLNQLPNAEAWIDAFEKSLKKACGCGKLDIVKRLLQELIRPYQMTNERLRVTLSLSLAIAADNGNSEIVIVLYDYYEEHLGTYELVTPLLRASKAGHRDTTQNLLQKMCKAVQEMAKDQSWKATVHEALLEAVENGNEDFFTEIIKHNPRLLWISEANSNRKLFQLAVKFRKEKIFNLIYGLDDRKVKLLRFCDQNNNNILHIAAYLSPRPDHLSKISGSALKQQREGQWFEQVKSLVTEFEVVQKNNEGKTPRQVFEESHEPLRKEGEEWMKYTAAACSFVAALIATVTFQAIFTVPGGTDQTSGTPLLLKDLHFTAFIMSDALAFFTSCTSVLIFLNILTARYSFDDFIVSLPRKMILGLAILFFSVASLLVAFITALSASMRQRPALVVPMKPLAGLPIVLFLMLQYPLLKKMISSTYGKGIFDRNTKSWFSVPKETQIVHVAPV